MSLNKTHYAENKVMSAMWNNTSFAVAGMYLALFTSAPDKTGGGAEVSTSGTAYVRQLLAPVLSGGNLVYSPLDATGSTISFATVNFPANTGSSYVVVAVGTFDASSGGNLWTFTPVTPTTIGLGQVATYAAGNITVKEA